MGFILAAVFKHWYRYTRNNRRYYITLFSQILRDNSSFLIIFLLHKCWESSYELSCKNQLSSSYRDVRKIAKQSPISLANTIKLLTWRFNPTKLLFASFPVERYEELPNKFQLRLSNPTKYFVSRVLSLKELNVSSDHSANASIKEKYACYLAAFQSSFILLTLFRAIAAPSIR